MLSVRYLDEKCLKACLNGLLKGIRKAVIKQEREWLSQIHTLAKVRVCLVDLVCSCLRVYRIYFLANLQTSLGVKESTGA